MARLFRHITAVHQLETSDCGVACLSMVLAYHGRRRPLDELRAACGGARDGSSALQLVHAARRFGVSARGLRCEWQGLRRLSCPAILHWQGNHYVVLAQVGRRHARIVDPAVGTRRVTHAELARGFSHVVLTFAPDPKAAISPAKAASRSRYLGHLGTLRAALGFVLLAALLQEVLAVALPAATQVLIDHVLVAERRDWLLPVGGAVLFATFARSALRWLRARALNAVAARLSWLLARDVGQHLFDLPLQFFFTRRRGDLIDRVQGQHRLREALLSAVSSLLDALLLVSLLSLMLCYDSKLGGLVTGVAALRAIVVTVSNRGIALLAAEALMERGREVSKALELVGSLELTQAFGAERRFTARYAASMRARAAASLKSSLRHASIQHLLLAFDALTSAALLWIGGLSVMAGATSVGVLASFLAMHGMLRAPLQAIVDASVRLAEVRGLMERSDDILAAPSQSREPPAPRDASKGLVARSLSFRFSAQSPWILRDVSLEVRAGQQIAIVGASGSGKSCLLRLLCGLLEQSSGTVTHDGQPLYVGQARGARGGVIGVMDAPIVLRGSVAANLRIGNPDATLDELKEACRIACFDEVIAGLRRGYAEELVEDGANLSGGERQRLALAQAILRDPSVLVLDEATSGLDASLERRVFARLRAAGLAVVYVSHRSAAQALADGVYTVDELRSRGPDLLEAVG